MYVTSLLCLFSLALHQISENGFHCIIPIYKRIACQAYIYPYYAYVQFRTYSVECRTHRHTHAQIYDTIFTVVAFLLQMCDDDEENGRTEIVSNRKKKKQIKPFGRFEHQRKMVFHI